MRIHDILADYGLKDEEADRLTFNAGCVVMFCRYEQPISFSRSEKRSSSKVAITKMKPNLVVRSAVVSAQVSSNKNSHINQAAVQLRPTKNFVTEVFAGDYMFVWIVQDQESATELVKDLKEGKPANGFMSGLKFFGKVNSVRKKFGIVMNGPKTVSYMVNAVGFSEFDASIYYEPYLATKQVGIATPYLAKFGLQLNELIASNGKGISVNKIIPALLETFYGKGVPSNEGITGGPDITSGLDNPDSFIVPDTVAKVFGVEGGSKPGGKIAYTDLLEIIHGVQKYPDQDDVGVGVPTLRTALAGQTFIPDIDNSLSGNGVRIGQDDTATSTFNSKIHYTGIQQLGLFVPSVPAINGQKTAWSLINQFLNPTINEVYTAMRTDRDGNIFPTFVLRQLPFSSGLTSNIYVPKGAQIANEKWRKAKEDDLELLDPNPITDERLEKFYTHNIPQTLFAELPRWKIHPIFLTNFDLGRSDALRFNFIHVQGEAGAQTGTNQTSAFVRDPPIQDEVDIARHGMRLYARTVPCAPEDIVNNGAGAWQQLLSDFLMGGQMLLTGSLECHGIVQPIVVGDNIEVDDTILHIEGVNHTFTSDGRGGTRFMTSLQLTHGVAANQLDSKQDDLQIYAGIRPDQLQEFEPSVSVEDGDE